jgi:hydroxymethylpyrimidine pyrophosphatase-like HAD family hydrolase
VGTPLLPNPLDETSSRQVDVSAFRDIDVVALDVDGTLLADASSALADQIVELHRVLASQSAPVDFVLVTGRPWAGVRDLVGAFEAATGRRAPHVVHFGSVVTDQSGATALRRETISPREVRDIVDVYRHHDLNPSAIQCDADLSETHWYISEAGCGDPATTYGFGVPIRAVSKLPAGVEGQAVLAKTEIDVARRVLADLADLGTGLPMEYHAASGILYVDSPGASKAEGLLVALGEMGISPERTLAVGDASPDISMFRSVRLGVAVASAEAEVIEAADFVCAGGPSGAVVEVLELLVTARADPNC